MKKKELILLITTCILCLSGCSSQSTAPTETSQTVESAPTIQEVESLSDAEIIIPSALVGNEISELSTEESKLIDNADSNTTTVSLTGEERTTIVNEISSEVTANINTILDDNDHYPDIESITPNSDCTVFTIALTDGVMNTYESMLVMSFYMIGDKYQIYAGISEPKTVVRYVNAQTGEVISESDSTSMNTFTE